VRLRIVNVSRQVELADSVEMADDGPKRRKGLRGRSSLSIGEKLWIVPCEAVHKVGMQFAIDLYLDREKRVIKVRHDVPPSRLSACLSAHSVLELSSGSISRNQKEPGDRLEFSFDLLLSDRWSSSVSESVKQTRCSDG
jgi:uncharacterized membrane protein (UPF0127 family)